MLHFYLEKRTPSENMARFYESTLFHNMFGDVQIDRRWGRIGTNGGVKAEIYPNIQAAMRVYFSNRAIRIRKNYTVINENNFGENLKGFIPSAARSYFSVEIADFLASEVQFRTFTKSCCEANIIFVGDLISLSEREVRVLTAGRRSYMRDALMTGGPAQSKIHTRYDTLIAYLARFQLQIGASTAGWKRPILARLPETSLSRLLYQS